MGKGGKFKPFVPARAGGHPLLPFKWHPRTAQDPGNGSPDFWNAGKIQTALACMLPSANQRNQRNLICKPRPRDIPISAHRNHGRFCFFSPKAQARQFRPQKETSPPCPLCHRDLSSTHPKTAWMVPQSLLSKRLTASLPRKCQDTYCKCTYNTHLEAQGNRTATLQQCISVKGK